MLKSKMFWRGNGTNFVLFLVFDHEKKGGDVLNVILSDSDLNVRVKGGEFVPLIKIILS